MEALNILQIVNFKCVKVEHTSFTKGLLNMVFLGVKSFFVTRHFGLLILCTICTNLLWTYKDNATSGTFHRKLKFFLKSQHQHFNGKELSLFVVVRPTGGGD